MGNINGIGIGIGFGGTAGADPLATIKALSPKFLFDASYGTYQDTGTATPATANNDPVGNLQDQSGNNNHIIQATAGSRPLLKTAVAAANGKSTLLFDGTADFLQKTFTFGANPNTGITLYIVFRQITWTTLDWVCDGVGFEMSVYQETSSPDITIYNGGALHSAGPAINAFGILTAQFVPGAGIFQLNNATEATGNTGNAAVGGFTLGAAGNGALHGNIEVCAVYGFDSAHSAGDRTIVKNYAATRFGITI